MKDWQTSKFWDLRFKKGEMPWDLEAPSKTLLFLEEKLSTSIPDWHEKFRRMLVPGCGHGNDVIALLEKGYEVHAVDWSAIAVQLLEERIFLGRLDKRGTSEVANFFDYRVKEDRKFDIIMEHTLFCAIDPADRPKYIESVRANIRKGGLIIGNFFIDDSLGSGTSLNSSKEGPPFSAQSSELKALFSGWANITQFEISPQAEEGRRPGIEWLLVAQLI